MICTIELPYYEKCEIHSEIGKQYLRYNASKAEIILIQKLLKTLDEIIVKEVKCNNDENNWIKYCIWQSIYISYHKLFSEPISKSENLKVSKHNMDDKFYLKGVSYQLKEMHDKIISIRNHYFVHGGTDLYENHHLFSDTTITQHGFYSQLNVDVTKHPELDDSEISIVHNLLSHLLVKIELQLKKCNGKILDNLFESYNKKFNIE